MLLTLTRWLFVASLLSSFGAAVFLRVVVSNISPQHRAALPARRRIEHRGPHIAGFVSLLVEAGAMAETATLAETLAALPTVLLGSRSRRCRPILSPAANRAAPTKGLRVPWFPGHLSAQRAIPA